MHSFPTENQICPSCQTELPATGHFCPTCGQNASQARPVAAAESSHREQQLNTLGAQQTFFPTASNISAHDELTVGDEFANRYAILKQLGRGGMGVVYLAKDKISGKEVAIKILNSNRYSENDVRRLVDEGVLARDIRHRNVVAVYDADINDGQPYLTMEYIKGQSLRELFASKAGHGRKFYVYRSLRDRDPDPRWTSGCSSGQRSSS